MPRVVCSTVMRSIFRLLILSLFLVLRASGAMSQGERQQVVDWMKDSLPEVPSWNAWQEESGELPPDFATLPKIPGLPDPLQFVDGRRVHTPADWAERRAEIRKLFEHYVTGAFPPKPAITNAVILDETRGDGFVTRNVRLEFGPDGRGTLRVQVTLPDGVGPFPVLICPNLTGWSSALIRRGYVSAGFAGNDFMDDTAARPELFPGYDFATLPRRAWAVQLVVDYLETLPEVDPARIALFGYSRDGKMATIAAALDERIAAVIAGSTGVGGILPWRLAGEYGMGEGIESTTRMFPTWFHPRLRFFAGREDQLPIDANLLVAMIAPRACLMEYGWNDEVSNPWGSEQTYHSAMKVYTLFGQPKRLGLLGMPGFHGANDQERCLDWLDMQFGRRPDTWTNEFRFPWNFENWKQRTGGMVAVNASTPLTIGTVSSPETWTEKAGAIRAEITSMLGEAPPFIPPPVPFWRRNTGPVPGPTAVSRPNPGQTKPDVPAWVIARRIEEFGWLSPEQDETDSRRIRFGYNVTGDLYYPKGTPADAHLPTVIWLHGFSYPLGYMWVYRRDLHPILALVKAGYAVLAFDQTGFGARQEETASFYERYPKWSRIGRMVGDVQRAIDALEKEPLVDANRISLFGYTLGGTVGLYAAALDSRIQGVVAISGFTPMRTDTADRGTGGIARYSHERGLIPRLGFYIGDEARIPYDFAELIATIAPRAVLIVQPQWGRGASPIDVRAAVVDARRVYTLHGASDRLALFEPSDFVRLPTKTQDAIIDWMNRALPVPAPSPHPPAP